ncbi:hypothetical protein E4U14_001783 [Claviceps sp. LM454 group G7]|nr:hypothetical protein E4U14_001783 [Claviceps sp. LM454 group G7]
MEIIKALLFLGVVSSNVFAIEAPIPGYDVETLDRNVHLDSPDGGDSLITFSGTIEEGTSKAKKLNSRWARDLEMRKPLPDNEPPQPRCTATREWPCKVDCVNYRLGPWYDADLLFVRQGFDYLMKHSGKPKLGPGPDNCERGPNTDVELINVNFERKIDMTLGRFREVFSFYVLVIGELATL